MTRWRFSENIATGRAKPLGDRRGSPSMLMTVPNADQQGDSATRSSSAHRPPIARYRALVDAGENYGKAPLAILDEPRKNRRAPRI